MGVVCGWVAREVGGWRSTGGEWDKGGERRSDDMCVVMMRGVCVSGERWRECAG